MKTEQEIKAEWYNTATDLDRAGKAEKTELLVEERRRLQNALLAKMSALEWVLGWVKYPER